MRQRKVKEDKLEERIETLESQLRKVEEENDLLRTLNKTFGNESDKLNNENKLLNAELNRYRQFRLPNLAERPSKRTKAMIQSSPEKSPDEDNTYDARVRIVLIRKFADKFLLTYFLLFYYILYCLE